MTCSVGFYARRQNRNSFLFRSKIRPQGPTLRLFFKIHDFLGYSRICCISYNGYPTTLKSDAKYSFSENDSGVHDALWSSFRLKACRNDGEWLRPQILFLKTYRWHVLVSLKNNSKSKEPKLMKYLNDTIPFFLCSRMVINHRSIGARAKERGPQGS